MIPVLNMKWPLKIIYHWRNQDIRIDFWQGKEFVSFPLYPEGMWSLPSLLSYWFVPWEWSGQCVKLTTHLLVLPWLRACAVLWSCTTFVQMVLRHTGNSTNFLHYIFFNIIWPSHLIKLLNKTLIKHKTLNKTQNKPEVPIFIPEQSHLPLQVW
jgi:hypothetical protein